MKTNNAPPAQPPPAPSFSLLTSPLPDKLRFILGIVFWIGVGAMIAAAVLTFVNLTEDKCACCYPSFSSGHHFEDGGERFNSSLCSCNPALGQDPDSGCIYSEAYLTCPGRYTQSGLTIWPTTFTDSECTTNLGFGISSFFCLIYSAGLGLMLVCMMGLNCPEKKFHRRTQQFYKVNQQRTRHFFLTHLHGRAFTGACYQACEGGCRCDEDDCDPNNTVNSRLFVPNFSTMILIIGDVPLTACAVGLAWFSVPGAVKVFSIIAAVCLVPVTLYNFMCFLLNCGRICCGFKYCCCIETTNEYFKDASEGFITTPPGVAPDSEEVHIPGVVPLHALPSASSSAYTANSLPAHQHQSIHPSPQGYALPATGQNGANQYGQGYNPYVPGANPYSQGYNPYGQARPAS